MGVDAQAVVEFVKMKLERKYKVMTFKIQGDKIIVDKTMAKGDLAALTNVLPENESRYACLDTGKKIHFILWTPDSSSVKDKMTYSSSKEALHKQLEGVTPVAFSAHHKSDFDDMLKA